MSKKGPFLCHIVLLQFPFVLLCGGVLVFCDLICLFFTVQANRAYVPFLSPLMSLSGPCHSAITANPEEKKSFAPISIALRASRPASKPALMCFVLMVLRHWSSRLALRPVSNFFWVCCNFHNLEVLKLALRPSLCASCGLKF